MRISWRLGTLLFFLISEKSFSEIDDSARDFERAAALLSAGQEDQAMISFGDFLRRYPTSAQADEAQYFVGEIYFRKKLYLEALKEFRKTQVRSKVDEETLGQATLRAGECWRFLGNPTFAKIEWEAVIRKFPTKKVATQAKDFLGELKNGK